MKKSPFEGFSQLNLKGRKDALRKIVDLNQEDFEILAGKKGLNLELANYLVENVIGLFSLPLAVAPHFLIDGKDVVVPMAIEETSVVAGVSNAAKTIRQSGGFQTQVISHLSIGQIQFPKLSNPEKFQKIIEKNKKILISQANECIPGLVKRGGGVKKIELRVLERPDGGHMGVLHVLFHTCDAMGANLINQTCENLKPSLQTLTGENINLCILSNLTDSKLVKASCEIENMDGELAEAIEEATLFAKLDPYRASTHNKGIMNGIDAVLIATGNDWRAVEAGIHAYAALSGRYQAVSDWKYEGGKLKGTMSLPMALGIVGGVTRSHPTAKTALKLMQIESSEHLSRICAAVGLAQNFAALRALCAEGISYGHMKLHTSNLALQAGAGESEIPLVQKELQKCETKTLEAAKKILETIRSQNELN